MKEVNRILQAITTKGNSTVKLTILARLVEGDYKEYHYSLQRQLRPILLLFFAFCIFVLESVKRF